MRNIRDTDGPVREFNAKIKRFMAVLVWPKLPVKKKIVICSDRWVR